MNERKYDNNDDNITNFTVDQLVRWYQNIPNGNNHNVCSKIQQKQFDGETLGVCQSSLDIKEELDIDESLAVPIWDAFVKSHSKHGPIYCVLGETGAGKSSFCNLISCTDRFERSSDIYSCTKTILQTPTFFRNDESKPITLIDFPGLNDADEKTNNINNLSNIIQKLCEFEKQKLLFIIVLNGRSPRINAGLTKMLQEFGNKFGHAFLLNTVLVFTRWSLDEHSILERKMDNYDENTRSQKWNYWLKKTLNIKQKVDCFFIDNHVFRYPIQKQNKIHQQQTMAQLNKLYNFPITPFNQNGLTITEDILPTSIDWIISKFQLNSLNVAISCFDCVEYVNKESLTLKWNVSNIAKLNTLIKSIDLIKDHELCYVLHDRTGNRLIEMINVERKCEKFIDDLHEGKNYTFELSICLSNCPLTFISTKQLMVTMPITCKTCNGSGIENKVVPYAVRCNSSGCQNGKKQVTIPQNITNKCDVSGCKNGIRTIITWPNCRNCNGCGEGLFHGFGGPVYRRCYACRNGKIRKEIKQTCWKCKGNGSISQRTESTVSQDCGYCANGYIQSSRMMSSTCSICDGKGWEQ